MIDGGPPALPQPHVPAAHAPSVPSPNQPTQPDQAAPHVQKHWSHFRSEFTSVLEEDAEAHLLHTNDRMNTHNFSGYVKVERFCLTLVGDMRLWYESFRPIANHCQALQEQFRQQHSKIGNTTEQLFYAWRSFHYDENAEMIDAYVNHIRQVAAL